MHLSLRPNMGYTVQSWSLPHCVLVFAYFIIAYVALLLHALQAGFGWAAIFSTLNEAYPQTSIILRHRRSA